MMAVQQPIAFAFNQSLVGRTLDVLIDAPAPEGEEPLARPDLRRRPRRRRRDLRAGARPRARATWSRARSSPPQGYDLIARPVSPPPPRRKPRPRPGASRRPRWRCRRCARRRILGRDATEPFRPPTPGESAP